MARWEFWIDVGGTFTDCLGRAPGGELRICKTLSSGAVKGCVEAISEDRRQIDDARMRRTAVDFWSGGTLSFGSSLERVFRVVQSHPDGTLRLDAPLPPELELGSRFELRTGEPAPLVAIRELLGLRLDEPIPPVDVRLGTTKGTNALLERKGARTAFVTTRGFGDVLKIGTQARPRLFDLDIVKPEPLYETVVEIDERIDAAGHVLTTPDEDSVRQQLRAVRDRGIASLAICLLHAYRDGTHEETVARIATELGFDEISVSSRVAPLIKIVSRGDTTTMDAYLSPVLREYLDAIRRKLAPGSRLRLMTSAGGLVDADRFVGKDSILSGPAGGVIGFSKVAERAGFRSAIGFDMGGTSTDVARFAGAYEREFETEKGGVRVVAPMLAIETVAAGGGSLCRFDGVKLAVGPDSAGADPGPACYGRGGPLTVTDMNLFLGRIPHDQFPFPLDRQIVERRLAALCDQIANAPLGRRYTPEELAEGFVKIANENMVRAVRKISVAKGFDPADSVLVSFGGAGGQHACAVARALGMSRILLHPHAGILSAYGIGLADVRSIKEASVLAEWNAATRARLDATLTELESLARAEVLGEGIPAASIARPLRSLELRYLGAETAIHVPEPDDGDFAAEFSRRHLRLYGYVHAGRVLEATVARVEAVGTTEPPAISREQAADSDATPVRSARVYVDGAWHDTAVYWREQLRPGCRIAGPAVVCEPIGTIFIESGFAAAVDADGVLILEDVAGRTRERLGLDADPIQLEIFNNLFASIAEQMGVTLQQTSFSTNVKERLDFSCAIFSPHGELVVNAPHIPVHLGAMSETVKCVLADNPDLAPGDVVVTNDPYRGGSHLPDVTVVTPVFDSRGELIFLTASRAHHAEIGGIVPGSMPPFSKSLAEEGILIRNFRLVQRGEPREAELRELLSSGAYPSRSVETNLIDISAQVAANRLGVALLLELTERYSLPVVQAYMQHIQRAASAKLRLALGKRDDGEFRFVDHLDDGSPIAVCITIAGESATIDFTGTGPVLKSNLNANRAITQAAVLYALRCLIAEDIPLNGGVLEPVTLVLPECLLNPPGDPDPARCPAIVGGNVETSQRVVDVLLGALALAAASQGSMNNLTFGDETFGYYETICGGAGATATADGADAVHTHMTNTRLTDVEVIERRYPVLVREFSIRRGSGGAGRRRGGDGIVRVLEFRKPLQFSLLTERREQFLPFGMHGGSPGAGGENRLWISGELQPRRLRGKIQGTVGPGDRLLIETPGGGGWGPPGSGSVPDQREHPLRRSADGRESD